MNRLARIVLAGSGAALLLRWVWTSYGMIRAARRLHSSDTVERLQARLEAKEYEITELRRSILIKDGRIMALDKKIASRGLGLPNKPKSAIKKKQKKMLVFDFNGTLGQKKGKRLRPGLKALRKLTQAGFDLGLWSNAARRNLPLAKMSGLGVNFSLVLDGEDCERPTRDYCEAHGLGRYDKIKPLSKRFPDGMVVMVDDTPAKIPPCDRHLLRHIPTWEGSSEDRELPKLVQKLLEEEDIDAARLLASESSSQQQ